MRFKIEQTDDSPQTIDQGEPGWPHDGIDRQ